jgi:hypothetical protein
LQRSGIDTQSPKPIAVFFHIPDALRVAIATGRNSDANQLIKIGETSCNGRVSTLGWFGKSNAFRRTDQGRRDEKIDERAIAVTFSRTTSKG